MIHTCAGGPIQGDQRTLAHRRGRLRGVGSDQAGQGVVELALILPVLLFLLLGIIEFGLIMNNVIALRQGAREGARQGAVAQFGSTNASCNAALTGAAATANANTKNLLCLTKSQVGLGDTNVRLKLLIDSPTLTSAGQPFAVNNALVLCASYKLSSVSGLFDPILSGRYTRTKTTYRIEQPSAAPIVAETSETDPSGGAWSWCTN